jgi:protein-tyrosine kinase
MERINKAVERARLNQHQSDRAPFSASPVRQSDQKIRSVSMSNEVLVENRIITGDDNDIHSHAYKVLRTRIWQQMRSNGWSTLGVTSANPGEGKTLTAINLAISMSRMEVGRTVILVDLDMRRPRMHKYFGFWPEYGVHDYLQGGVPLEDIIVNPGIGDMMLVPGNVPVMNSSEILSSPRMPRLLQEIKVRFPSRLIIFDLPPVLATDDVLVLAPSIDALLLVVEEGKSKIKDIRHTMELLKDRKLLGTVLNKSEESTQVYGY